ncbi:MAG: hypothetical protein JSV16_01485, partial [Candidatus Hydrogenedentota bacterium]
MGKQVAHPTELHRRGVNMKHVMMLSGALLLLWPVMMTPCQAIRSSTDSISKKDQKLPYVYTDWKHFTTQDGLPNDHVFAVEATADKVWVGTEDGLACIDKRTGKIKSWNEKDGLPWRVVSALAYNPKTGELWIGLFGGGLARFSGGRFD